MAATCELWPATAMPVRPARMRPARGLDAADAPALHDEARHLAVLDDVDAERVGGARIAPGHGVVARRAGPPLQERATDGEARLLGIVEIGQQLHDVAAVEQLGVDAVEPHDVAAARQRHRAALGPWANTIWPRCDSMTLKLRACDSPSHSFSENSKNCGVAVDHVVRAHDRGVAPDIAGADIAASRSRRRCGCRDWRRGSRPSPAHARRRR